MVTLVTLYFGWGGFFLGENTAHAQVLSNYIDHIRTTFAGGDPIPDNLFDTSGANPFSNLTINGGESTLAATWQQIVTVQRGGDILTTNAGLQPSFIQVT
jgi:hypothetical protein